MKSTCPYCGVGCGVEVSLDESNAIVVKGDSGHPANRGHLCSKGSALAETLDDAGRLLYPTVDGARVNWDQATNHVATQLNRTIEQYGRESIAFYLSGQILTEDYYVVNKLTKGWLGTANVDTNSRLCMASSVVGHKRAFGADTVPGSYEDLEQADMIVLIGSNLAWCHPVLYQRIMAQKERRPNMFIVVIDPRRTMTADAADLHLPIQPDSDTALFNGLLRFLALNRACDDQYVRSYVDGFDATLESVKKWSVEEVAIACDVSVKLIREFYERFCYTERSVSVFSQGVNQSVCGSNKVNAIINCHLATGRIGKPGMGPFSITGQPNAMGGREVGGLATVLASHMELNNPQHRDIVQTFWDSPYIADKPGLCAVDLFKAVEDGRIKAIWIMGTNPVDSMPEADSIKSALNTCPLVIVSDVVNTTDTLAHANVCLPAHAWGEKDGTVTNSERCISRQRRIKPPAGESRADWWAVCEVARKIGYEKGFTFNCASDIFREHAALSGIDNKGERDFDISACARITPKQYDKLQPFYWPWLNGEPPTRPIRFFGEGSFFTDNQRAKMLPIALDDNVDSRIDKRFPLTLNTGRNRDQWHTMTRTGYSTRLSRHLAEPYIAIHPQDASDNFIGDVDIVCVRSTHSQVLVRALLTERQKPGQVFIPMHWSDQFSANARVDTLISARVDPYSKQPASKFQPVSIDRYTANSYAYGVTTQQPALRSYPTIAYWAISPVEGGWQFEAASSLSVDDMLGLLNLHIVGAQSIDKQTLTCKDSPDSLVSQAVFSHEKLSSLVFLDNKPVSASRSWVQQQLIKPLNDSSIRWKILAGRAGADQPDKGAIVCSCYIVGASEIKNLVMTSRCKDINAVGQATRAGTNCGSCRNEIQSIINECKQPDVVTSSKECHCQGTI